MENTPNFNLPTPKMFLTANRRTKEQLLEDAQKIIFDQVNSMYESDLSNMVTSYMNLLDDSTVVLDLFKDPTDEKSISLAQFEFLGIIRDPLFPKAEFTTWLREHHWKLNCLGNKLRLIEIN